MTERDVALQKAQETSAAEAVEAAESWSLISDYKIKTEDEYKECVAIHKEAKHKFKFLDEERKITVAPANAECDRINDWFRPALTDYKRIAEHAEGLMRSYILQQNQKAKLLLAEAEKTAMAALAATSAAAVNAAAATASGGPPVDSVAVAAASAVAAAATHALVNAAAMAPAPKVAGLSMAPAYTWVLKNLALVDRKFLMLDEKAMNAHVKANGLKDVPAGVEVHEDVKFRQTKS